MRFLCLVQLEAEPQHGPGLSIASPITVDQIERRKTRRPTTRLSRFFSNLGPGLITGAADDDPSGISTYSVAGAGFGYLPLWTALFSFPLMSAVQLMCARLGLVTGRGLASVIRVRYPRWVLWASCLLLVVANVVNIGADLGGMAQATWMATGVPAVVWVAAYGAGIHALLAWSSYRTIARTFKWLTLVLLAYVATAFVAGVDWRAALLATSKELRAARQDVVAGMFTSNAVMYFIILATAATLHAHNHTRIATAQEAAEALRPLAGPAAFWLFTLGLMGTGMLAVPVLAGSCAYAIAEARAWRGSLENRPAGARRFYAVLGTAMAVGAAVNYAGLDAISMLFLSAVINGVLAPPLILVVLLLTRDTTVMGTATNSRPLAILGWIALIVMVLSVVGLAFAS